MKQVILDFFVNLVYESFKREPVLSLHWTGALAKNQF